jgi:serine protease Do
MQNAIDLYQAVVIEIATPYAVGTGFYLRDAGVIVTNEHVIRDNREVVIHGEHFPKQLAKVLFIDERHDLAFVAAPAVLDVPNISLGLDSPVRQGDLVVAVGHPFGFKYSASQGIVSNVRYEIEQILYIQHDAALNPGNSGGPLINSKSEVIGINTFRTGNSIGMSLPVQHLAEALAEFQKGQGEIGVRCHSCSNGVFKSSIEGVYCPHCGAKLRLPDAADEFEPVGVAATLEEMLEKIGHPAPLSRSGPHCWTITQGSARINIHYHEGNGIIMGDAYLCTLPKANIKPLYEFLLRQNYTLSGLSLSIKDQAIILSLIIHDRYLNVETGLNMFQVLFEQADHYDNILVEQYGAVWRTE